MGSIFVMVAWFRTLYVGQQKIENYLYIPNAANEKPLKGKNTSHLEYKCLVRATDGRKKKISTVVSGKELVKFQDSFETILKANMDNLKKRERKKSRK
jgi:hypothetical protein